MTSMLPREPGTAFSRSPSALPLRPRFITWGRTKKSAPSQCLATPQAGMMDPSHGGTHQPSASPSPPTLLPAQPSEHPLSFTRAGPTLLTRFSLALHPRTCSSRPRQPSICDPTARQDTPGRCPSTRPSRRSPRHRTSTLSPVSAPLSGCLCRKACRRRDRPRRARPGSGRAPRR